MAFADMCSTKTKTLCVMTAIFGLTVSTLELGILVYKTATEEGPDSTYKQFLLAQKNATGQKSSSSEDEQGLLSACGDKLSAMEPDFVLTEIALSVLTLVLCGCLKYGATKKRPYLLLPFLVLFLPRLLVPCLFGTVLMVLSGSDFISIGLSVAAGILVAQVLWAVVFFHFKNLTETNAGGQ